MKKNFSSKTITAFVIAFGLMGVLTFAAYSYYVTNVEKNNQYEEPLVSSSPTPEASPSPTATTTPTPKPTAVPTPKPSATTKPVSSKMFKITAPTEWDTQKVTRYFFTAYAYEPIKTMTLKFEGGEFELTPDDKGNFSKVFDIKVGQTVITVTAVAASGKTETQTQTYTVTKGDTLSQVDPKLTGVQCDGAKLDECKNFSGYSTGMCSKYTLYLECLRSKCDVNTLPKDPNCKNQY